MRRAAISMPTNYTRIARAMHIHPTVTELIPTLLQELAPLE
jgi:hypothetical protein